MTNCEERLKCFLVDAGGRPEAVDEFLRVNDALYTGAGCSSVYIPCDGEDCGGKGIAAWLMAEQINNLFAAGRLSELKLKAGRCPYCERSYE